MIRTISYILLLVFVAVGCKNDPPTLVSPDMNDVERAYFEDYDSPELKWGYINKDGKLKIDNIYDDSRDFIDGIALVNLNGKWGFINDKGKTIIEHQFMEASPFNNGLSLVKDFEGNHYFINKSGQKALSLEAEKINEFDHGLSVCMINGLWGAFDTEGDLKIAADYKKLKILNENHVLAKKSNVYQLLDHNGKLLNDLTFDRLLYDQDLPYVIKQDNKYYVLDEQFRKIDKPFGKLDSFKGKVSLAKEDGQYKLIDIRAKQIRPLEYEKVEYAGEGKWKYKKKDKWGLLDENGDMMTEARFHLLNRYKEGYMVYGAHEDSWGYLDSKGNIAVQAKYPLLWDYHNGYARFISRSGFGFIDKSSEISVQAGYFELRDLNDGLARAQLFW